MITRSNSDNLKRTQEQNPNVSQSPAKKPRTESTSAKKTTEVALPEIKKNVTWNEEVTVMIIPNRTEYYTTRTEDGTSEASHVWASPSETRPEQKTIKELRRSAEDIKIIKEALEQGKLIENTWLTEDL